MTDDSNDNNEKAIKKVVKKHVSDVFGEEEKAPEPADYDNRYGGGSYYPYRDAGYPISKEQADQNWKRDNPGFAFQRAGKTAQENATSAAWGKPQRATSLLDEDRRRHLGRRVGYSDTGPEDVNYTPEGWKSLRRNVMREVFKAFDWEDLVIMPDDHTVLEQVVDTVMRRCKLQLGTPGNAHYRGTLVQVPISVGDNPPAEAKPLPASSADLPDAWGQPGDDEKVIDVKGDDNE